MHHRWIPALAATALLAAAASAAAQDVAWSLTIRGGNVEAEQGVSSTAANPVPKDGKAVLTITCNGGTSCNDVKATVERTPTGSSALRAALTPRTHSASTVGFDVAGSDVLASGGSTVLRLALGARGVVDYTLVHATPVVAGTPPPRQEVKLADLLVTNCASALPPASESYFEDRDLAIFVVTPTGNVLRRPAPVIDENDSVRVTVVADERLIPLLGIRRKSELGTPGALHLLGEGANLNGFLKQALVTDTTAPRCGTVTRTLYDFKEGKGEVEISAITGKEGDEFAAQPIGTFEFAVNKLYTGAFSLGAMRTTLADPTYGLRPSGTNQVITRTENGDFRVKYLLMYTHFIWGRRDPEKPIRNPLRRVNPSMGVVIDDIPNNWVGALTADPVNGIYLSYGIHYGRVTRLDPDAHLKPGDVFTGEASAIPTRHHWVGKPFVSITIDVRAAAELVRMALTGAKGS